MDKPLGRDSLGRLVYEGDCRTASKIREPLIHRLIAPTGTEGFIQTIGFYCPAEDIELDIDASPKRTNYERYFADLGTLEEVSYAQWVDSSLSIDEETDRCWWDDQNAPWRHCFSFESWLNQEATL